MAPRKLQSRHASLPVSLILLSLLLVSCLIGINSAASLRFSKNYNDGLYRVEPNLDQRYKYRLPERQEANYQISLDSAAPGGSSSPRELATYDDLLVAAALEAAAKEPDQDNSRLISDSELNSPIDLTISGIDLNVYPNDDLERTVLDRLDLTEQQQQQLPLSDIISADQKELELQQTPQRAKPIVTTLVEDEPGQPTEEVRKQSPPLEARTKNATTKTERPAPTSSIGKVIERESDRSDKPANWRTFLDRIYEAVFGTSNQDDETSEPTNNKVTKPSEFSNTKSKQNKDQLNLESEPKQSQKQETELDNHKAASGKSQLTKQATANGSDEGRATVRLNDGRASSSKRASSSLGAAKNTNKDKTTPNVSNQTIQRSPITASGTANQEAEADARQLLAEQDQGLMVQMEPEAVITSASNEQQEETRYSMMRKSTMVLPVELDEGQEEAGSHKTYQPIIYTTQVMDNPAWHPTPVRAQGPIGAYKAYPSRHYHTLGQPIYGGFPTTQQIGVQAAGTNPGQYGNYQPNGLNRSNDLYFLVVVGAFCVMAMAMILGAGLFVYRVQQNRKTCTETEYPTYGVVGPNNVVGGKLGVSPSFVGGYFAQNAHAFGMGKMMGGKPGANSGDPSEGFNSPNDSGIGGIGGAKSSSKRSAGDNRAPSFMASQQNAARMYHYQHQKQQMITSERNSSGRHTSASDLDSEEENEDGNYTVYECPGLASAHDMEIKNPLFHDDRSP